MKFLLYVTGAAAGSLTPINLITFDALRPDDEIRVVLSRTAETFVTVRACAASGSRVVYQDSWDGDDALHIRWSEWADRIIVYPATLNFLGRLRSGTADTPMMLALQCSTAPVLVCPSLPPGSELSPAFRLAQEFFAENEQYHLVDTVPGYSLALATAAGRAPISFAEVLELCAPLAIQGIPGR